MQEIQEGNVMRNDRVWHQKKTDFPDFFGELLRVSSIIT